MPQSSFLVGDDSDETASEEEDDLVPGTPPAKKVFMYEFNSQFCLVKINKGFMLIVNWFKNSANKLFPRHLSRATFLQNILCAYSSLCPGFEYELLAFSTYL